MMPCIAMMCPEDMRALMDVLAADPGANEALNKCHGKGFRSQSRG
jgi:hypothetical protein